MRGPSKPDRRAFLCGASLLAATSSVQAQLFPNKLRRLRDSLRTPAAGAATALPQGTSIVARWSAGDIPVQPDNTALATWTDSVGGIAATGTAAKYRSTGASGKPFVQFTGGASYCVTAGANAALTAMQATTNTVFVVYRNPSSASTVLGTLVGGNTSAVGGNLFANSVNVGRDWGQAFYLVPFANPATLETIGYTNRPIATDGGTNNGGRVYVRGCCVREQNPVAVTGAATGITIGGSPANTNYGGPVEIYEVLVWNRALTSPEMKQVEKWVRDRYGLPYPWAGLSYFPVFHGNSIANGYGSTTWAKSGPALIAALKGWPLGTWENDAAIGLNWTQLGATAARDVDPLSAILGVPVQLHAWEWNNSGRVAATTYSQCTSYFANRRGAGIARLVVSTSVDLSDSIDTAAQRADRAAYNGNIASNWATFADAYAPLHGDAVIGVEGTCPAAAPFTPNFFDGQHPTDPGYAAYRDLVAPILS